MADQPDYSRIAAPVRGERDAVSAHDLAIADLQAWQQYDMVWAAQSVLVARKRYGLEKYGSVLHPDDDRPADQDAEDEAVDLVVYLRNWMAKAPELRPVLEPLYRNALWTFVVISLLRSGEDAPHPWMQPQVPLADLEEVRGANLADDDTGHAITQDGFDPQIVEISSPNCGGHQRNGYVCIRALSKDGWCPRHGKRVLPDG